MVKKMAVKFCILLAIIGVLLSSLSTLLIYKIDHRGKLLEGLYHSSDEYDVVLMGSSHMNGGIDPNVLWKQHGIASFNYATGGQPIDVTYYLLKEVLKKHKPSVVVVDLYYLGLTKPYGESGFISNVLDNMNFSVNKLEAIRDCVPPDEWIYYFFPALKYHFRWAELTAADWNYDSSSVYYTKGFSAGTNQYGKEDTSLRYTHTESDIPSKGLQYLNKIIELSKEYHFQLVFINMPCDYSDSEKQSGWVTDCEALFNTVADYLGKRNIPFLDLCDKIGELQLDFTKDMNNSGHLNLYGACKASTYFGDYLKQNYSLPDHRKDSAYAQWDKDYQKSQAASILHPGT